MEFSNFLNLLRKKKQTIFTIVFFVVTLTLVVSLTQTIKYTVKSRLLVVQDSSGVDAYALSRSNEYLGSLFAEIVYSSSFYDQVIGSSYGINQNYFYGNYSQQIKKWQNTVKTRTQGNTGIIEVYVFHPQVTEAKKIALAVNDILINKNQAYQSGSGVKVSIIDQPIASTYPNKPNLVNNLLIAFFISFLLSLLYIYIFPEEKYSLRIFSKKNKNTKREEILYRSDIGQSHSVPINNHQTEKVNLKVEPETEHSDQYNEGGYLEDEVEDDNESNLKGNIGNLMNHW